MQAVRAIRVQSDIRFDSRCFRVRRGDLPHGFATARSLSTICTQAGAYRVTWKGRDSVGNMMSHGVYFYRLSLPDQQWVKKMTLLR